MNRITAAVLGMGLTLLACSAPASLSAGDSPTTAAGTTKAAAATTKAASALDSAATARPDSAAAKRRIVKVPTPSDSVLIGLLREGNRIMLIRHAATDWSQRDADRMNYADRGAQRNLSDVGRAQADSIGRYARALGLKIGHVYSSPMFRCRDTAEIAFGRADTTSHLFVKSKESREVRVKWLSAPLTDGALLVLVSHQDPYLPLFGFQRDQLREGDVLLIQPVGSNRWVLVAQLAPADWARLAARYAK